jgi:tetratricopeptide (TPR) repeat protein
VDRDEDVDGELDEEHADENESADEELDEDKILETIARRTAGLTPLELRFLGGEANALPMIGDQLLDIALLWEDIRYLREQRDDKAGVADAAGEAWHVLERAIPTLVGDERHDEAVELALFMANEIGCYYFNRDNSDASAGLIWNKAIALRAANPQLPTTLTHARLFLNRGVWLDARHEAKHALAALDRAVSLYAELEDDDARIAVELGRTWRRIGMLATSDEERERAFSIALAILATVESADAYREAMQVHHDHATVLRKASRFADAVPHARRAVIELERIDESEWTPQDDALLAGLRGCVAWSLGGAKDFAAAHAEGRSVHEELRRAATETDDAFALSILKILDRLMPMWGGLESAPSVPPPPREKVVHSPGATCSFCQRTRVQVKKLISGPQVYICDSCVGLCLDILAKEWPIDPATKVRRGVPKKNAHGFRCSFCDADERRGFVQGPEHRICDDCVDLCVEIIEEEIVAETK